jgi:hypothetical protein
VAAPAFPFTAGDPFFVKEKPFDGPGYDPIDDVFIWQPRISDRIVNA